MQSKETMKFFHSILFLVVTGFCFPVEPNNEPVNEIIISQRGFAWTRPTSLAGELLLRIFEDYTIIRTADEYVEATGFDGSKPLYIDFRDRLVEDEGACFIEPRDLLKRGQLILVDWADIAHEQYNPYEWKLERVREVTDFVTKFLESFKDLNITLNFDRVHFRGEGIGVHIAAKVVAHLGVSVATILAVNPARAVFEDEPLKNRLDKSDARYVSVIHYTDDYDYSMQERIGHSDIYIIGGRSQLGFNQNRHYCVISPSNYTSIAYSCGNQRRFLEGRCLDNPSIRINSVLDDKTDNGQGVFYHKLSVIGNNGPFIGNQLEYIKHAEESSRHFRIVLNTISGRNQMRIEASLSDDGENFYETQFTPILDSDKKTGGRFEQMITRPAVKGTNGLRLTLRYRHKPPYVKTFYIKRLLMEFPEFGTDKIIQKRRCFIRLPVTEASKSPRGDKRSWLFDTELYDGPDCVGSRPADFP